MKPLFLKTETKSKMKQTLKVVFNNKNNKKSGSYRQNTQFASEKSQPNQPNQPSQISQYNFINKNREQKAQKNYFITMCVNKSIPFSDKKKGTHHLKI